MISTQSFDGILSYVKLSSSALLHMMLCLQIAAGVVGLLLGQLCHRLHGLIPRQPLSSFYLMEAGLNTLYVILVVKAYQLLFYHSFCGNQRGKKDSKK